MVPRNKKCTDSTKNGAEWVRDGTKWAMYSGEGRDGYFRGREG